MYSEPSETSKIDFSPKLVDCIQPLTIFAKKTSYDVSQGYEYAFDKANQNSDVLSLIP